ncbi:hypothetical protein JYT20_00755, partial [Rhodothermus sp. AH-315-K08]|nr:hypothetical protein [Rhodothermus sp. AH-315-K08]
MLDLGVDSRMVTKHKEEPDDTVVRLFRSNLLEPGGLAQPRSKPARHAMESVPFLYREFLQRRLHGRWKPNTLFNYNLSFISLPKIATLVESADVVCLHSIQYFLSSSIVKEIAALSGAPLVWTLMDVEPFTGGCHFNNRCDGYVKGCGNCPQLGVSDPRDLSRAIWAQKEADLAG